MSWGWVLFGLACAVLLAVFVAGIRVGAQLPPESSMRARRSRPAKPGERGYEPTAVYLPHDRDGRLLYVGIASDPQRRANQHADDKEWAREVASVESWWFADRYVALGVEWALIKYLRPPHNRAPSGSCDAWTEKRPAIRPAQVRWPHTRARMASVKRWVA